MGCEELLLEEDSQAVFRKGDAKPIKFKGSRDGANTVCKTLPTNPGTTYVEKP